MTLNPHETNRGTATAFGILLIAGIVSGVLSSVPAIEAPDYLITLPSIKLRVLVAVFFQTAMTIIYVFVAVITYPVVRMDSRRGALAYLAFRLIGAAFLFVGIVTLLLLLALGRSLAQTGGPDPVHLEVLGALLRFARDGLNHIGVILPWSLGGLYLYVAFLRTGLIPRWMSIWGLAGTVMTLAATLLYMLDQVQLVTTTYFVLNAPTALLEVTLAVVLITRGFDRTSAGELPAARRPYDLSAGGATGDSVEETSERSVRARNFENNWISKPGGSE